MAGHMSGHMGLVQRFLSQHCCASDHPCVWLGVWLDVRPRSTVLRGLLSPALWSRVEGAASVVGRPVVQGMDQIQGKVLSKTLATRDSDHVGTCTPGPCAASAALLRGAPGTLLLPRGGLPFQIGQAGCLGELQCPRGKADRLAGRVNCSEAECLAQRLLTSTPQPADVSGPYSDVGLGKDLHGARCLGVGFWLTPKTILSTGHPRPSCPGVSLRGS